MDNSKATRIEIQVPSATNPAKHYTVTITGEGTACDCPAWRFQDRPAGERTCKHMAGITIVRDEEEDTVASTTTRPVRFGDLQPGMLLYPSSGDGSAWLVLETPRPSLFGGKWGRLAVDTRSDLTGESMVWSSDSADDLVDVA